MKTNYRSVKNENGDSTFFFCIVFVFGFLQFLQIHKNYVTNSTCIKYTLHNRITQIKIHYTTLRDKRNEIKRKRRHRLIVTSNNLFSYCFISGRRGFHLF